MSNLVDHARRELETIKEDPQHIEGMLKMVETFAEMGHSGASAAIAIAQLNGILQFQNLSPLTDDPDEWYFHGNIDFGLAEDAWHNGAGGVWQNKRNGEAFSNDGGKTYYLLSEGANASNPSPVHNSRPHKDI